VVSFLLLHSGESIRRALYWLMGHLKGASWPEVTSSVVLVAIPFVVLLAYARDLNVMLLGEEDAQSLGIEVERTKRVLLALSAVITAAGVAVAGIVGFVGLIVPHVNAAARRAGPPDTAPDGSARRRVVSRGDGHASTLG